MPDRYPPIAVAANHPPIHIDRHVGAASFDTSDSPIGLRDNSPSVSTKYAETRYHPETRPVSPPLRPPSDITQNAPAVSNIPSATLPGVGSSRFLRRIWPQNQTTTILNEITNIALIAENIGLDNCPSGSR